MKPQMTFFRTREYMFLFFIGCLLLPPPLSAQSNQKGMAYLKKIETRYKNVQCFRARFHQLSKAPGVVTNEKAGGVVYLKRGGKFRWDYDQPDIVLIICDGETLWIYQPEDRQVMVDKSFRKRLKRFPYTFLSGIGHFDRNFVSRVSSQRDRTITLELTPKKPLKEIKKMQIIFSPHTLIIRGISWTSHQGVQTIITFDDIDVSSMIPDSVFRFVPPPGVDIVNANAP